ncbi:helix-turn-helix domain-containing protein [Paenibacillus chartarius]|uniref:Helix-turn-helix domain-containing protein n=1 Tax=Paenibacillus chartarius TaxID=747481 RepID=A0ABV6DRM0_9BACL
MTWFFSYLTVLLLPILISIVVYYESAKTLESEIHSASSSLLNQLKEIADNQFANMQRLSFEMTWNIKVQELMYSNKYQHYQNEYRYDLYQITQDLKMYRSTYSFIDNFYIYINSAQTVLLPGVISDAEQAYVREHQDADFTYERWRELMTRGQTPGFVPILHIGQDGEKRKAVAYLESYRSDQPEQPLGMNVVITDQARILRALGNVELFNKGQVLILNRNNEILVSNDASTPKLPSDFPYDKLTGNSGFFYLNVGGQRYEVFYLHSPQSECKYISMIPSRLFWEKAEKVRNFTYASFVVSLLGGGLLTFIFLRRNYGPIRRLLRTLDEKAGHSGGNKGGNEFHYIEETLGHTFMKMDEITSNFNRHRSVLRSHLIMRLLKGKTDPQIPLDDSLTAYSMKFISDEFAVMLFLAEETDLFYESYKGMSLQEKQRLLHFIIANVVEDLASRRHAGFVAEVDDAAACLINLASGSEDSWKDDLKDIAKEVQSFLHRAFKINLTVSISSIHSTIPGINQAYNEALDAMEYKLVIGRKEILTYDQISKDFDAGTHKGYYYPLSVEQQLINYVKVGDFEKAKSTVDHIMDQNLGKQIQPVQLARCLMFDLTGSLIKTINEIGDVQETFLAQNPKAIERLMASETIQDMRHHLTDILLKVCSYTSAKRLTNIQHSRQQAVQYLVEQVIVFIESHYQDVNLNISLIGEQMDMKPFYLSKLFKDQTGEGLLDYINKYRIGKAKSAMREQKLSVHEAAELTGFSEVTSFIRTFKKYEGITPGKFKEMEDQ